MTLVEIGTAGVMPTEMMGDIPYSWVTNRLKRPDPWCWGVLFVRLLCQGYKE